MAQTYKSIYKRFNGTDWDTHYFKTSADVITETTSYKVMEAAERTAITTYLRSGFNGADQLVQLDSNGVIPSALIPGGLEYLEIDGSNSMIADMNMGSHNIDNVGGLTSPVGLKLYLTGQNGVEINAGSGMVQMFNELSMEWNEIKGVATPTTSGSAATKGYVDGLISTGTRPASGPVKAASTVNLSLSGTVVVDGVSTIVGDRVLVKAQSTASENGIYEVASGAWTKITEDSEQGIIVFVEQGTTHNDWIFYNETGTNWVEFSKVDTINAGAGLTKNGTTLAIDTDGIQNYMIPNSEITFAKIADWALPAQTNSAGWQDLYNYDTAININDRISDLTAAVRLVRGTATYNTDNLQTVSGAYSLAGSKIKTYIGSDPSLVSTPTDGDLFFETI